jgi:glycosyltransferase involved in cell wall biosynthesis
MSSQPDNNLFKITAVIPAYNVGEHIGRTIDSVLNQTRPADEIIIVDDGSTDNTAETIRQYEPKVRLICQKNAGASAARNTGIEAASNDWIAFLDGDDEWLDQYLEKQIEILKRNHDLAWIASNFTMCYCNEERRQHKHDIETAVALLDGKDYFDEYFKAFIQGTAGCTDTIIARKDALQQAGMFDTDQPMANDLDMWWRIAYRNPKIGYNPEPLAIYHLHVSDSITKIHRDPEIMSDLIARHMEIAAGLNRSQRFLPCAQHMLRYWIHECILDDRIASVGKLIKRFGPIFPLHYRLVLNLLTIQPKLTSKMLPFLQWINRKLHIRV